MKRPEKQVLIDGNRGIYIPQIFAQNFLHNISQEDKERFKTRLEELTQGPENEFYWDSWDDISSQIYITDDKGNRFWLYQDGDLWAVPEGESFEDEEL